MAGAPGWRSLVLRISCLSASPLGASPGAWRSVEDHPFELMDWLGAGRGGICLPRFSASAEP